MAGYGRHSRTTLSRADLVAVLAWTDAGQHLENGPSGPWQLYRPHDFPLKSVFIPTMHHFTDETMKLFLKFKEPCGHGPDHKYTQSNLSLASNYGLTLDPALASADSFYALTELFQSSAASICQLLNLAEMIIDNRTGHSPNKSQDFGLENYRQKILRRVVHHLRENENQEFGLENLSYHQDILKRLALHLRENIGDLEGHHSAQWPRSYSRNDDEAERSKFKAAAAAQSLLRDFRHLLFRTEYLYAQCQSEISVCMKRAAIAESQQSIEQAKQVGQLTGLAFFYIPLSFTTSFLGMNLKIFGSGKLQLWIWFAFAAPLLAGSYFALAWLNGQLEAHFLHLQDYFMLRREAFRPFFLICCKITSTFYAIFWWIF